MEYKIEQDPETGNFFQNAADKIKDVFTGNSAGTKTCDVTGLIFMLFMTLFH